MGAPALRLHPCPRCDSPIERGDLRCAVCAFAVREVVEEVRKAKANVVRCNGCGACVAYDVKARAPRCAYCGSETHVESVEDPIEQAEAALPFAVAPMDAKRALRKWLGTRGFFCPSDLKQTATIDGLKPMWWPAWVFDVRAEISWAGDSNLGARRSKWAPYSGLTHATFQNVVVSASRGLTDTECRQLAPATKLFKAVSTASAQAGGPPGAVTEQFDVQRSAARQRILDEIESLAEQTAIREIPGSAHRNVKVSVVLRQLHSRRLSIPTYVLAYRYKGDLYRALVHGQDAQMVLGSTPTSWVKVFAVIAAVVSVVAIAIALLTA